MVPILRLFMDRVHRRLIASMFRCNDAMQAYIRKSGTPYDNTTVNQYICTTLHLCRIGLMNHRRCNALNSYSDKSVMMRLAVSAVPYFYRYSNPTANKRGKNVGCIVSNRGGSLWRRDGSVWRFRPRKSRLESLYLCTRATGCIVRLQGAVGIGSPAIRLRTDFYVRQNIARCVSSNSILFGLLPKTLPCRELGCPSEVGAFDRRRTANESKLDNSGVSTAIHTNSDYKRETECP